MTYTADDNIATLTAYNNADGSTQVADYTYGTTTPSSTIVRNDLLAEVEYSDSGTVLYTYNAQGQQLTKTDQNGTVHNYSYDFLGRLIEDAVSMFGTGVDTTIATIQQAYEVRGYLQTVTSLDGSSSIVNQVQMNYNGFGQLYQDYQEHYGAVTGGSMLVGYSYVSGTSNTIRRTQIAYPSGYNLNYLYNSSSTDDYLSRVSSLLDTDGTTHLADYTYLGASDIVGVDYSGEAAINYNLGSNTGAADPYTGGFDQFDRVILDLWQPDGGGSALVKLGYTFDLAGNRLTRADAVAQAQSPAQNFDEAYLYDGLYRLIDFQRGQLSGGVIDPSTLNYRQNWQTAPSISSSSSSSSSSGTPASVQLDSLGNWLAFNQDTSGAGFSLTQTRTHNTSNEILSITGGSWTAPAYDNAGNTTSFPQATDPTSGATATYDAWNRMVSVSTGNTYAYDGLNRLVQISVSGLLSTDLYYSDQWQLLELWASIGGGPSLINQRFVWGLRYVDDPVLRDRSTAGDGTLDERLYSLQDAHWSVVALFDPSAPGVVERHAFDAYGNPFFLNPDFSDGGDSYAWSFLYSGYLWDPSTGLFYIRNRVYHAPLGRWLQRDPLGYEGGDTNLYEYAVGSPTSGTDPSGLLGCAGCSSDGGSEAGPKDVPGGAVSACPACARLAVNYTVTLSAVGMPGGFRPICAAGSAALNALLAAGGPRVIARGGRVFNVDTCGLNGKKCVLGPPSTRVTNAPGTVPRTLTAADVAAAVRATTAAVTAQAGRAAGAAAGAALGRVLGQLVGCNLNWTVNVRISWSLQVGQCM